MAITPSAARVGELGEEYVARHLKSKGFRILDRNWRIKEGEIDLVVSTPRKSIELNEVGDTSTGLVIFVEVKTRTSVSLGDPLESIGPEKAFRIQRLALAWLATHGRLGSPYRIDAAGVLITRSGEFILDYRESIL